MSARSALVSSPVSARSALILAGALAMLAPACRRAPDEAADLRLATASTGIAERAEFAPTARVDAAGLVTLADLSFDPRGDAAAGAARLAELARAMPTERAFVDDEGVGPALPAEPLRLEVDRAAPWGAVRALVRLGRAAGLFRFDLAVVDPASGSTALLDLELERAAPGAEAAGRPRSPLFALANSDAGAWVVRRPEGDRAERAFADPAELAAALAALEEVDPETRLVRLDAPADARWERVVPLFDALRGARLRVWLESPSGGGASPR